jgi:YD repeat-containing protein
MRDRAPGAVLGGGSHRYAFDDLGQLASDVSNLNGSTYDAGTHSADGSVITYTNAVRQL